MRIVTLLLILFLLYPVLELSGQAYPGFEKIDNSIGLSSNKITSIVKDNYGFVWIGTQNGLNRYDGYESKIYRKQNSLLSSNDVSDLFIDSKGRLWVATHGGGLNMYNFKLDKFKVFKASENPDSLASNQVNVVFEDQKGSIWLGTENGLSRLNEVENTFLNFNNTQGDHSLSHNSVTSISQTDDQMLWVGTFGGGLNQLNIASQKFQRVNFDEAFFASYIFTIFHQNDKNLLIGTSTGLFRYDIEKHEFSNYLQDLGVEKNVNIVRVIAKDQTGNLWIGTDGNGLFKIEGTLGEGLKIQNFLYNAQLRSSLSGNAIYTIMEDDASNLWIGTGWNGVNVIKTEVDYEFILSDKIGENPYPVLSIFKDENKLYLGLDGNGLTRYSEEMGTSTYSNETIETYLGGKYVQFIHKDIAGTDFWLGTFTQGIIRFNPDRGTFDQFKHSPENSNSLSYNDTRYILPEDSGNLWVATWGGGLNYFDRRSQNFKRFRASDSEDAAPKSDNILALQKMDDKLWIATYGGGLSSYDLETKKFQHFLHEENTSNTPSSNNLFSLLTDSSGILWIGTSGDGINSFDTETKKFNRFPGEKALRYANVMAIVEDNDKNIWFSTKNGIWQYHRRNNQFRKIPGLNEEFHINSTFKDKDGLLYFGGIKGVLKFDPTTVEFGTASPCVMLTNFKLFNKELPIGEKAVLNKNIAIENELILKHDADVITFEFAALHFPFSKNLEYAIKLENFDENWRAIGTDRTATYTNLAPGDYIFKVRSKVLSGSWEEAYTSIGLTILKPFWLTWWAICIYILIILALFYAFKKYIVAWEQMKANLRLEKFRHEKDNELYTLKQQFFTNISHEIRTPVTLILGAANSLVATKSLNDKKPTNLINTIHKHGNHLLNLVNELPYFRNLELESTQIKPTKSNFINFCKEIFMSFQESARQKHIKFTWQGPEEEVDIWFDAKQMEKVLYNLISNALKFTPEYGSITIRAGINYEHAVLEISDTGIGIKKKQRERIFKRFYQIQDSRNFNDSGFGLGLSISKDIVDLHSGELYVESRKKVGATFILKLLRGNKHFKHHQLVFNSSKDIDAPDFLELEENRLVSSEVDLTCLYGCTLMIVEDNDDMRTYISGLLAQYCRIIEAKNGQEALELIEKNQPDVVISDIVMPDMDGVSLTRELKTNLETSHIPVILLTARAISKQQIQGYEIGADMYITKPFNEIMFKLRLKNLINSQIQSKNKILSEQNSIPLDLKINTLDQEFIKSLIATIKDNIDMESINADFISKELGMSHSVIYKKVKALTGMTLVEYVRDIKLNIAKNLIAKKGFSVSDASYKVGYSNRKYFSKLFKKKFGANPSEYN